MSFATRVAVAYTARSTRFMVEEGRRGMGHLVASGLCWAVLGLAVARGVAGVARLSAVAKEVTDAWDRERRVRACAMVAAAGRNLDAATAVLGDADPGGRDRYGAAASEARDHLADVYFDAAGDDDCTLAGAELAVGLHLQWHPGQPEPPAPWPNWVPRYSEREP